MSVKLTVFLDQPEYTGLIHVADAELRDPRDELRVILRRELARCGLWPEPNPLPGDPAAGYQLSALSRQPSADS